MIVRTLQGDDELAAWDAFVEASPGSGFMQLSAWLFAKELDGCQTRIAAAFEDGKIAGGAGIIYARNPGSGMTTILHSPHGPVLPWHDPPRAASILRHLGDPVRALGREVGAVAWRVEPALGPPRPDALRGFTRAPLCVVPETTLILDCTLSDHALLAQMHSKGRYNARLAERHGVTVERCDAPETAPRFHRLLEESGDRHDFFVEPMRSHLNIARALAPERALWLFARRDGVDLAAGFFVRAGTRLTYLYGGSSGDAAQWMAPSLLHLEATREARRLGLAQYDLWGFEPHGLHDHQYYGFSQFKRKLGGAIERHCGAFDVVLYEGLAETIGDLLR